MLVCMRISLRSSKEDDCWRRIRIRRIWRRVVLLRITATGAGGSFSVRVGGTRAAQTHDAIVPSPGEDDRSWVEEGHHRV